MYIKVKKRPRSNKYYFYKAYSYRNEHGKVKNKQEYLIRLTEGEIFNNPKNLYLEIESLRKKDLYSFLQVLTKIQFDILGEKKCELTF
ncbi:hypothetical protein KM803_15260 [Clostridium tyrobutyricum]|jgi:hypothetical protein|uniref:hypothetical protein n=1 Tax=Clostridium tyrobutyricum TaxID=1519 RepID=UPI0011C79049|nr:hypothetical protein [Clostridium tyrobutyricum]MBV4432663.1 hypothetical protein [Clostridium tyrobutyricum]